MIERAANSADLGAMLPATNDTRAIQAYLGHRNIQNTTRYTALAPQRFREFFRD
jgi:site-specific recombinase XerC